MASDKCQAKKLRMTRRPCRSYATETLGDKYPAELCDKHMAFYWMLTEHNPEEAARIRKKVGMRR